MAGERRDPDDGDGVSKRSSRRSERLDEQFLRNGRFIAAENDEAKQRDSRARNWMDSECPERARLTRKHQFVRRALSLRGMRWENFAGGALLLRSTTPNTVVKTFIYYCHTVDHDRFQDCRKMRCEQRYRKDTNVHRPSIINHQGHHNHRI